MKLKLLPWRYDMFGLSYKNISWAFLIAAAFLFMAGGEYVKFGIVCIICSSLVALFSLNEMENNREMEWASRRIDDATEDINRQIENLGREVNRRSTK